jgi:predicted metal-binding membrane protein
MRERIYIAAEIGALTALAWLYLVRMPMTASDFGSIVERITQPLPSPVVDFAIAFLMWAVMMVAMMLPSASPMILTYARIAGGRSASPASTTWMFTGGYLAVWTGFSIAATALQFALAGVSMLTNALTLAPAVGAAVLIAAGLYQFTPWKNACLSHCQSPVGFFMTRWRDGMTGAFRMGLEHGTMCVGCCWMLMALLFAAGVMNLTWVAALTILVLVEKVVPYPRAVSYAAGAALIAMGVLGMFPSWLAGHWR